MDREKVIEGMEAMREFFGFGLPSQSPVFEAYQNILTEAIAMLKEQEDMGKELTDAMELVRKKNERIKKLEEQIETLTRWRANAGAFD